MVPRFSTPFARSGRPDLSPNPITQLRAIYFYEVRFVPSPAQAIATNQQASAGPCPGAVDGQAVSNPPSLAGCPNLFVHFAKRVGDGTAARHCCYINPLSIHGGYAESLQSLSFQFGKRLKIVFWR